MNRSAGSVAAQLYILSMSDLLDALDVDLLRTLHENPRSGCSSSPAGWGWPGAPCRPGSTAWNEPASSPATDPTSTSRQPGTGSRPSSRWRSRKAQLTDVAAELTALPAVLEAYATTGSSDVLCRIAASSHQDLQNALLALNRSPYISRSTSVVVLSTVVAPRTLPLLANDPRSAPRRAPAYRDAP